MQLGQRRSGWGGGTGRGADAGSKGGTGRAAAAAAAIGMSALSLIEREESGGLHIVTCAQDLDRILGGGLKVGSGIIELTGVPGCGKTQLCMQLSVNVQVPAAFHGLDKTCVYIDTEGSFTGQRIRQIAGGIHNRLKSIDNANRPIPSVEQFLQNINVYRCFDQNETAAAVVALEDVLKAPNCNVGLIIVDSISFPFRHIPAADMAARTAGLLTLGTRLSAYSQRYGLAVVVTNQMTTRISADGRGVAAMEPALGQSWTHVPACRVLLTPPDPRADASASPSRAADMIAHTRAAAGGGGGGGRGRGRETSSHLTEGAAAVSELAQAPTSGPPSAPVGGLSPFPFAAPYTAAIVKSSALPLASATYYVVEDGVRGERW
eukprot:GHVU01105985.1.p1 GENE.GHVU01105985.1~~GHVU01105985.1.p1  ORF type:complete len:377 (-),score=71.35 GHVU01105985.1:292-1422(-)